MKSVTISYFASLREERGISQEILRIESISVSELYLQLNLSLDMKLVRFAVNNEFVPPDTVLNDGDHLVFIPPVAGG